MNRTIVNCRYCHAEIIFIQTPQGKALPCDPALVPYKLGGYEKLLTEDGEMVKGYLHYPPAEEPDGMAYRLHFASCTHDRRRERRKERASQR